MLPQGALAKSFEARVKIGKTCLPQLAFYTSAKSLKRANHLKDTICPSLMKR